jgi:hypothetical protein
MQLDPRDEEDRALLHAVPSIVAALLSHLTRDPKRIVVLFSTRRSDQAVRVLATADAFASVPAELAEIVTGAPKMPTIRVVSLRRDGTVTWRDTRASELTDMEETAPS